MITRSCLVSFPAIPFKFNTLLPKEHLASTAAALLDAGHETRILDYGNLDTLERLSPDEARSTAQALSKCLNGDSRGGTLAMLSALVRLRGLDRQRSARARHLHDETAIELAREFARKNKPDFVVFDISHAGEFHAALRIGAKLRGLFPSLPLVAMGDFVGAYGPMLSSLMPHFNCLCLGDPRETLPNLAERIEDADCWTAVPNLFVTGHPAPRRAPSQLDYFPTPCYSPDVYPAAADGTKFHLYTLQSSEASRGADGAESPKSTKSPRLLADELAFCFKEYGAGAFHLSENLPAANHSAAVAHELLSRCLPFLYSTEAPLSGMNAGIFTLMQASGCRAAGFRMDTGSQWLLDDYYGRDLAVSEIDHILKTARKCDLAVIARLTYPCPPDDYHTRAETMRIVARTRPHAVLIDLPEAPPNSLWRREPARYGFHIDEPGFLRQAAAGHPQCAWSRQAFPHNQPRSWRQSLAEREMLAHEIEQLGISTTATPELALAAHIHGCSAAEYSILFNRYVWTWDAGGVESLLKQFNARVLARAKDDADYMAPLLAAVGN